MAARIVGVGKYLPSRVLTNADLERMVETSDQWIVDRTGIRERRLAAEDESAATMGATAARMALQTAGIGPESIDLVICATITPDGMFPTSATMIQDLLGARNAGAFDVNAACNGFIAALASASQFIENRVYERVLVVGSEVLSRIVNWTDRGTCVLFGDGAGAVLLERGESGGAGSFVLKSDGSGAKFLYARGPGSAPATLAATEGYCIVMDGREVFRYAVRAMEDCVRQSLKAAGLEVDDLVGDVRETPADEQSDERGKLRMVDGGQEGHRPVRRHGAGAEPDEIVPPERGDLPDRGDHPRLQLIEAAGTVQLHGVEVGRSHRARASTTGKLARTPD